MSKPPKDIKESLNVTLIILDVIVCGGIHIICGIEGAWTCGQSLTIPVVWPIPTTPTTFVGVNWP